MHNNIIIMQTYSKCLLFFICTLFLLLATVQGSRDDQRKVYIVYMGELPEDKTNLMDDHHKLLMDAIGDKEIAIQSKVHTYGRSLNGFAAKLLPHEADQISKNENVVSVFPSSKRKLHTTRSWDFLGIPITVQRNDVAESDIIIGLLDTGIYIPSKSFSDAGYSPPPQKWKGVCQTGNNFTGCNNKVIGAQYFDKNGKAHPDQVSPADYVGHGTHTSSIAAGVPVYHASFNGIAEGTARGGVPHARIAMYKTCWTLHDCWDEDILAGFDAAIADGVDILSVSIGNATDDYLSDAVAIGSFHAIRRGILVSCSGGNDIHFYKVLNVAPWIMTVAASTIDRTLEPYHDQMSNGKELHRNGSLSLRTIKLENAPVIADFSSRGPETISNKILKPDLAAPGQYILAAYTELKNYERNEYVIMSGTSMACAHASSAAAYIKSFHPDWSPAAIRSALMTTAKPMRVPIEGAELATGAGNIDPVAALHPGLIYDMDPDSYIGFLCQLGYNDTLIGRMSGNMTDKCSSDYPPHPGHDGLNYPSIHYQLMEQNDTEISAVFERKLKNVGEGNTQYRARVTSPPGLSINVEPATLYFRETMDQASFKVTLNGKFMEEKQWYLSGSIQWINNAHIVKTPILIFRPTPE